MSLAHQHQNPYYFNPRHVDEYNRHAEYVVNFDGTDYRKATQTEKNSAGGTGPVNYANYPGFGSTGDVRPIPAFSESDSHDWVKCTRRVGHKIILEDIHNGTSAVINNALEELHAAFPPVIGAYGGQGENTTGPRIVRGSGKVIIEGGVWDINEPIELRPQTTLVLAGCELRGNAAVDIIKARNVAVFSRNSIDIKGENGARINGNGIALNGVDASTIVNCVIRDIYIDNCIGDGVFCGQGQWIRLMGVTAYGNGGWGFNLNNDPNNNVNAGANDIHGFGCIAEENGAGGVLIGQSATSTWYGLTTQFHHNAPGIRLKPNSTESAVNGCVFIGCHFESNLHHVEILSTGDTLPIGTVCMGGTWIVTDGRGKGSGVLWPENPYAQDLPVEERFADYPSARMMINEGLHTKVIAGGTFNAPDIVDSYPTTNGVLSNAQFEQSDTKGSLRIEDFQRHRGAANDPLIPYACKPDGSIWSETEASPFFSVSVAGRAPNGTAPFNSGGYFGLETQRIG